MDNPVTILGPKGLIKKHEFVRIMIQCLYSLGYRKSAACLESESGISYKSMEFDLLESQILNADWDDCLDNLYGIKDLRDEMRVSALFLVFKQCLLESLNHGDDSSALAIMRKKISALQLSREKVHELASVILSLEEMRLGKIDDDAIHEMRKGLLLELEKVLPPPIALPERRLEHLVEMAVSFQIDSCMYHNSFDAVSLYRDHHCGRDQIPTETFQILTNHQSEVWFVQFSNNGEYLASASRDRTAIIWKVLEDGKLTLKHRLRCHLNPVSFVAWSPDDTMLLTCGEVLNVWDAETGSCKHTFGGHDSTFSSCAWFPDSKRFVCGSRNGICMWDCEGNKIEALSKNKMMPCVLDLAVTPDGENLISTNAEEIRILNLGTNVERVIYVKSPILSLSISQDSKFFIVILCSQEIHMWDVAGKWEKPLKYEGHMQKHYVIRCCFGGLNSAFIASGSENSQVCIWTRGNSNPIEVLSGHSKVVNCVSWHPRRHQLLASASDDQTIRIWGPSRRSNNIQQSEKLV